MISQPRRRCEQQTMYRTTKPEAPIHAICRARGSTNALHAVPETKHPFLSRLRQHTKCPPLLATAGHHAPSLPNSFVHSSFRSRSTCDTVGRLDLMALIKSFFSTTGSSRSSDATFSHVISSASGSPGEHGVRFSWPSTVTWNGRGGQYLVVCKGGQGEGGENLPF